MIHTQISRLFRFPPAEYTSSILVLLLLSLFWLQLSVFSQES